MQHKTKFGGAVISSERKRVEKPFIPFQVNFYDTLLFLTFRKGTNPVTLRY
ncbi:MAG: hypothetical protein ACI9EQ_001885 [Bacteroidia bacterium]|jgi:hypothetical protein